MNERFDIREPDPLKQPPIIDAEQDDASDDPEQNAAQEDQDDDSEQEDIPDDAEDETFDDAEQGFIIKMPGKPAPPKVIYAGRVE